MSGLVVLKAGDVARKLVVFSDMLWCCIYCVEVELVGLVVRSALKYSKAV